MFQDGFQILNAVEHVLEKLVVSTAAAGYLLPFPDLIDILNDVSDRVGDLFREHDGREQHR